MMPANVVDRIKELETFDGLLDGKCVLPNGNALDAVNLDVGGYVQGVRVKPFCKIIISDWNSEVE